MELIINQKEQNKVAQTGKLSVEYITVHTDEGTYRFKVYADRKQMECIKNPQGLSPTMWKYDKVFSAINRIIEWYKNHAS